MIFVIYLVLIVAICAVIALPWSGLENMVGDGSFSYSETYQECFMGVLVVAMVFLSIYGIYALSILNPLDLHVTIGESK